jgi:hypothetical protein
MTFMFQIYNLVWISIERLIFDLICAVRFLIFDLAWPDLNRVCWCCCLVWSRLSCRWLVPRQDCCPDSSCCRRTGSLFRSRSGFCSWDCSVRPAFAGFFSGVRCGWFCARVEYFLAWFSSVAWVNSGRNRTRYSILDSFSIAGLESASHSGTSSLWRYSSWLLSSSPSQTSLPASSCSIPRQVRAPAHLCSPPALIVFCSGTNPLPWRHADPEIDFVFSLFLLLTRAMAAAKVLSGGRRRPRNLLPQAREMPVYVFILPDLSCVPRDLLAVDWSSAQSSLSCRQIWRPVCLPWFSRELSLFSLANSFRGPSSCRSQRMCGGKLDLATAQVFFPSVSEYSKSLCAS